MWRAGLDTKGIANDGEDDDWETDPDFVVSISWYLRLFHSLFFMIESFVGIYK